MRRVSHDLPGVTQRIAKLANHYQCDINEAQQIWKDAQGRSFFQQHTSDIQPMVSQLTTSLSQLIELVDRIGKQLKDEDKD